MTSSSFSLGLERSLPRPPRAKRGRNGELAGRMAGRDQAMVVPQPNDPVTPAVPEAPVSPAVPDPGTPADPEEPATVPAPEEPATPAVPEPGPGEDPEPSPSPGQDPGR
jgi:hypothetical protein